MSVPFVVLREAKCHCQFGQTTRVNLFQFRNASEIMIRRGTLHNVHLECNLQKKSNFSLLDSPYAISPIPIVNRAVITVHQVS